MPPGRQLQPPRRHVPVSDAYSLALGKAVARRLAEDPERVRATGYRNLVRARQAQGASAQHWIDQWQVLLDGPDASIVEVLTSPQEWARTLRQTSPFAGVLDPRERWVLLDEVKRARRAS